MVEGLEAVCKTVARYAAIERVFFGKSSLIDKMLEDSIVATYASILRFLSKCRKYFDLGRAQRLARSITQLPETSVKKRLDRIAENDKRVFELTKVVDGERLQFTGAQPLSMTNGINDLAHGLQELRMNSTDSASKLECRCDQRHQLLRALDVLLEKSAHIVKIFVSSRDDVDIVLRLQNNPNIYINIDDNKRDIHIFIQFAVQKARNDRRLLKGIVYPDLTMLITENLAMKAHGMYVVYLNLEVHRADKVQVSLGESANREPVRQSTYQD